MPKTPKRHRQSWTAADGKLLRQLERENTPTRAMGIKLERTPEAVQSRASQLGVSLKPVNQSRDNLRKK
jgi:hypothetical protein